MAVPCRAGTAVGAAVSERGSQVCPSATAMRLMGSHNDGGRVMAPKSHKRGGQQGKEPRGSTELQRAMQTVTGTQLLSGRRDERRTAGGGASQELKAEPRRDVCTLVDCSRVWKLLTQCPPRNARISQVWSFHTRAQESALKRKGILTHLQITTHTFTLTHTPHRSDMPYLCLRPPTSITPVGTPSPPTRPWRPAPRAPAKLPM